MQSTLILCWILIYAVAPSEVVLLETHALAGVTMYPFGPFPLTSLSILFLFIEFYHNDC